MQSAFQQRTFPDFAVSSTQRLKIHNFAQNLNDSHIFDFFLF
jgi:hypothetical protein